jgi:hypothetical protein
VGAPDPYKNVKVEARRRETDGLLELGAIVDGVFVSFAASKLPDFDARVRESKGLPALTDAEIAEG